MERTHLERANRALLRAVETPPDTGVEPAIDSLAARLWALDRRDRCAPDPGRLRRLDCKLAALRERVAPERAREVERARQRVRDCLASLETTV